jgi:lipid II:glycine glycyltransferase (peptidoglycan interpeptide bridge formation enzyme)
MPAAKSGNGATMPTRVTTCLAPHLDADAAATFDRFCATSPHAAYQQSRAWIEAAPASRVRDHLLFLAHDGDEPIGAAVVRRTGLGRWAWSASLQRGPVVHDVARFGEVLAALQSTLAQAGCSAVTLAPRAAGRALPHMLETLRAHGFVALPAHRQPLHVATGIVPLDRPEQAVLAGFKQRGRRQLRLAAQIGVTIRPVAGPADLAAWQDMLDVFARGRPDYDTTGQPDAVGQARLVERLGGGMLLAELEGAVIGAHAFVVQAGEAIWLSLATSPDRSDVPRAYPLLWEAMRTARALGCTGYDLAGLPLAEPRDAGEANRAQFKTAFAPEHRILPAMHFCAIAPVRHLLVTGARGLYRGSGLRRLATRRGGAARARH